MIFGECCDKMKLSDSVPRAQRRGGRFLLRSNGARRPLSL